MYDVNFLEETLRHAFENQEYYNVPKGIRRHDFSNMHGWWVRVSRDRTMFRKLFSDGVCGSIEESFKKAILYRHEILSNFPVTIKKISNRGLPLEPEKRIKRCVLNKKGKDYYYWEARWYDKEHTVKFASFYILKNGEEEAKSMALEAATVRHNKKIKLSKVVDPYINQQYEPLLRADVEIWATISNSPQPSTKENNKEIIDLNPFAFEGERKLKIHKSIERDRKLRAKKVAEFLDKYGKLFCELCHFNFLETYPFLTTDIIEVHHVIPLASLSKSTIVNLTDLMLLCSNCHFAVHQGDAEENLLMAIEYFESLQPETKQEN